MYGGGCVTGWSSGKEVGRKNWKNRGKTKIGENLENLERLLYTPEPENG